MVEKAGGEGQEMFERKHRIFVRRIKLLFNQKKIATCFYIYCSQSMDEL